MQGRGPLSKQRDINCSGISIFGAGTYGHLRSSSHYFPSQLASQPGWYNEADRSAIPADVNVQLFAFDIYVRESQRTN